MAKKPNIIIVDDDEQFLAFYRHMLARQARKWNVLYVTSVNDALAEIEKTEIDTVIADLLMPVQNGFELLKQLRESPKTEHIPIIVVTGASDDRLRGEALNMGATDVLSKSVCLEELIARITNMLRLKTYQDYLKNDSIRLLREVSRRTAELERSRLEIIMRLAKAAEYRDNETGRHIIRVGSYCRVLAEELEMGQDFIDNIFLSGPLHDIGKIGIPDSLLLKQDKLNDEEWEIMKCHCVIGCDILSTDPQTLESYLEYYPERKTLGDLEMPLLEMAHDIALCHHERWDGSGYPNGLHGLDIPPAARIVTIADVYDALRSKRPYKEAYSEEKALEIMDTEEKHHFDPKVYAAFCNVKATFNHIHNRFQDESNISDLMEIS